GRLGRRAQFPRVGPQRGRRPRDVRRFRPERGRLRRRGCRAGLVVPPGGIAMTANADIATTFLRMCARGEVRAAYERYVSADFVHHNAWFPGDRESLLLAMEQAAVAEPNKSF